MIKKYSDGSCNVYYIDDARKILVDAGCKAKEKVDIIVLTHCHFDHINCADFIKKRDNCLIYASEKCAEHLRNMDEAVLHVFFSCDLKPVIADKIIKDGDTINTGDYSFEVIETPGHTDDAICLYDRKHKILFSGDTLFDKDIYGRTDLPTGSESELKTSIKRLKKMDFDVLYPGH